jgi:hypothetical protein
LRFSSGVTGIAFSPKIDSYLATKIGADRSAASDANAAGASCRAPLSTSALLRRKFRVLFG